MSAETELNDALRRIKVVLDFLERVRKGDEDETVSNGIQDLPSIAKMLADSRDYIESQVGDLVQVIADAGSVLSEVQLLRHQTETLKDLAAAAADAAQIGTELYPDEAEGLANTVDGDHFRVESADPYVAFVLHYNNGGVSEPGKSYPSSKVYELVTGVLNGYGYQIVDVPAGANYGPNPQAGNASGASNNTWINRDPMSAGFPGGSENQEAHAGLWISVAGDGSGFIRLYNSAHDNIGTLALAGLTAGLNTIAITPLMPLLGAGVYFGFASAAGGAQISQFDGAVNTGWYLAGTGAGSGLSFLTTAKAAKIQIQLAWTTPQTTYDSVKEDINALASRTIQLDLPTTVGALTVDPRGALITDPAFGIPLPVDESAAELRRYADALNRAPVVISPVPIFLRANVSLGSSAGAYSGVRIPNHVVVRRRPNPIVVATCNGLVGGTNDDAPRDLALKRCAGDPLVLANWSVESALVTGDTTLQGDGVTVHKNQIVQPCPAYDPETDKLPILFGWRRWDYASGQPGGTNGTYIKLHAIIGHALGTTWTGAGGAAFTPGADNTTAIDLSALCPSDLTRAFPGPGRGIRLRSGKLLWAIWSYLDPNVSSRVIWLLSYDPATDAWAYEGRSIAFSQAGQNSIASEVCLIEMPTEDNKVYVSYRDDVPANYRRGFIVFDLNLALEARFVSWGIDPNLPDPHCHGSLCEVGDGRIALINMQDSTPGLSSADRKWMGGSLAYDLSSANPMPAWSRRRWFEAENSRHVDILGVDRTPNVVRLTEGYSCADMLSDTELLVQTEYRALMPDGSASTFNSTVCFVVTVGNFLTRVSDAGGES